MSILNRPYAGTWSPNQLKIIQWTPDTLVYLQGDTSLAGCPTCRHRIDIQQFVTGVTVDAGVDPGASSASISLSIPRSYGDSIFRDGNTLLRNGLEVHVYFRGYFPMTGLADPNADPESASVAGVRLSDLPQHPYYPAFHGVVTQVSHEYSSGYFSASLTCSGMLHFWQYMQIASNGSFFGARPNNSAVRTNLRGHVYTGMSPFSIIYSLYRDTAGSAAGVGFALQSRTNMQAVSTASGDSLYSMAIRYWERRFMQGMYGLRMHGASGQLFSGSTQAYLARLGGGDARLISVVTGATRPERDPLASSAAAFDLIDRDGDGRVLRGADLRLLASSGGTNRDYGVVVPQMQAFVNDISQWGQVNFFETTYETKLDIATQVANICGYEFFQDMDGDLVFKPPLYNLDTSSSRIYRIEPEDIVSISFTESEPEATYATVRGGPFQNLRGAVDEAEWGVRSTYYDYRLVAQFGWREGSLESSYYSNARSAYYAAVANLDRINQGMNGASVTIPLRAEIRPGFPVYVPHIDCFYYVTNVSHSFSFGGTCTTTLSLTARRRKFIPPGDPRGQSVASIDLGQTSLPPRSLQYLDNSGVPRVLGFPNVVMALDPERINPLFFFLGLDAEEGSLAGRGGRDGVASVQARAELLASNFAQILVGASVLGIRSQDPGERNDLDTLDSDFAFLESSPDTATAPTAEVTSAAPVTDSSRSREDIIAGPWWVQTGTFRGREITAEELRDGLRSLLSVRSRVRARVAAIGRQIRNQEQEYQRQGGDGTGRVQARERIRASLASLRSEAATLNEFLGPGSTEAFNQLQENRNVNLQQVDVAAAGLVYFLINEVRERNPATASRDMSIDSTGAINDSATLLDLLNDRKANLGLNTPGYYRYYSSAHPDPEQQGYVDLRPPVSEAEAPEDLSSTEGEPSLASDSSEEGTEVSTSTVGVEPLTRSDDDLSENLEEEQLREFVRLVNKNPSKGLNVRTFASHVPTPTATDQIFALSFEQRTASRFGTTRVFEIDPGQTVADVVRAFRACLTPASPLGRALGTRFVRTASSQPGGLTNAAETGGALVTRVVAGMTGLTGSDNAAIETPDITAGTPNNRAEAPSGTVVTDETLGAAGTEGRARTILENKGNALIYQVSQANSAAINQAISIIENATPVSPGTVSPTVSTPVTTTDAQLAERVSAGHGRISADVIRSTRAIESGSPANPRAVRIEYRRIQDTYGIDIPHEQGEPTRAVLTRALAENPGREADILSLTSFGYYQVLGNTLLRLYPDPNSALAAFDSDPVGVSDRLFEEYLDRRPAVREAMEAVTADPSEANISRLSSLYTGAALGSEQVQRRNALFQAGLTDRSRGRTSGSRSVRSGSVGGLAITGEAGRQLSVTLSRWMRDVSILFGDRFPSGSLPFTIRTRSGVVEEPVHTFSPVFPVSDAVGYEHYGTYQYGRGLSIEPGGNYETLMGTDPFQYVDADLAYRFADSVRREGAPRDAEGNVTLGPNALAALREIASDDQFVNSPGRNIAIRIFREDNPDSETTDQVAMIASGLANYVMSSRDAITHLPVSNVAFRLSDLAPFQERDTCECRGAEADLLLGAYMSGAKTDAFVSVDTPDRASQWVAQQMTLAADSWVLAQTALRGVSPTAQGRQSILDTVQGVLGIVSQAVESVDQAGEDLSATADPTSQNLRRLNEIAGRIG